MGGWLGSLCSFFHLRMASRSVRWRAGAAPAPIQGSADPSITEGRPLDGIAQNGSTPLPNPREAHGTRQAYAGVVVPLQLRTDAGLLSLFSTTTVFGTPVDITLSELAIEAFFPADAATADVLRAALAAAKA